MVCPCCKIVVKKEMDKIGIPIKEINSNEVETEGIVPEEKLILLQEAILPFGLELIYDKRSKLVERIKIAITTLVNSSDEELKTNLSAYLKAHIHHNYNYLNNIFKEETGTTIEKFFISNKIEKVKELLNTDEMNLSEIAYKMQYSSLAHLSNQFKKVTGIQPSYFRQFKYKRPEINACA